MSTVLTPD